MADLIESLRLGCKWLDRYESQGRAVGEENTKAGLIEPILEGLGWDIRDPDEVCREYRRRPVDNPVDYALLLLRTPRLLVEAKGIGGHLDDPKWANQTMAYATAAGVQWVVLTNGAEWRIYNSHAPVPLEQKLFRTVRLREDSDDTAAVLQLLGKDNMRENRIEELWKAYFVDQQVHEALRELFRGGEPAKALVSAVLKRTTNLTPKDVRTSLARVRAMFEFPAINDPTIAARPKGPAAASPNAPSARVSSGAVGAEERKVTLVDLLGQGLIASGATLQARLPDGREAKAILRGDGRIDLDGTSHATPSGAGAAAKEAAAGHALPASKRATDGWGFWKTRDGEGTLVTLKELRRRSAKANKSII